MSAPFGRLLVVDDEKPVLDVLSEYFESQGHAVEPVQSGPEALAAFTRSRPDLVLLDIRMPVMDGVEVLKRIRALGPTPVIMVTANEDVALARLTLKLGAFDYVAKPFDFGYLDRAVTAALLHAAETAGDQPAGTAGDDPWRALVVGLFRAARGMPAAGRASIGVRLEDAGLRAVVDRAAAPRALDELDLLLEAAVELGDLDAGERDALAALVAGARDAVRGGT